MSGQSTEVRRVGERDVQEPFVTVAFNISASLRRSNGRSRAAACPDWRRRTGAAGMIRAGLVPTASMSANSTRGAPSASLTRDLGVGLDESVSSSTATAFLRDGIEASELTLVVLADAKIAALKEALVLTPRTSSSPTWTPPAPTRRGSFAWREFVDANPQGLRGDRRAIWPPGAMPEMSEMPPSRRARTSRSPTCRTSGCSAPTTRRRSTWPTWSG